MKFSLMLVFLYFMLSSVQSQDTIHLPAPDLQKGQPLMKVLSERQSTRSYLQKELPVTELANLLWAANGFNRRETARRTAPTSQNKQEIEIFVSKSDGLFRYHAQSHSLVKIHGRDIRASTGMQSFVVVAPVNIIIVADLTKMAGNDHQIKLQTAYIDAGYVSQNIYLYCASENLATVVRGSVDREKLAAEMGLPSDFYIVVAQSVGYPEPR